MSFSWIACLRLEERMNDATQMEPHGPEAETLRRFKNRAILEELNSNTNDSDEDHPDHRFDFRDSWLPPDG